jgi:phage terminase large subunit-like protein
MQAKRLPSLEAPFKAYCLNMPVAPDARWIAPADWDACAGTAEAKGPCYGGLDLSAGPADLTAFSLYWPASGLVKTWGFVPSAVLAEKEREDAMPYATWRAQGHIVEIPGRTIDRAWLLAWIAAQVDGLELQAVASDRWMLNDLKAQADREGIALPLEPIGMGFKDQSPALAAFEAEVLAGRLRHQGNPLLRASVANVAIDLDPAGNRKATKARSRGRIDPAISAVLAVAAAAKAPAPLNFEFTGMALL